jgi:L-fuconate dehydratase
LSAWNYARCARNFDRVVVEQVGFCSQYFLSPSVVSGGRIRAPMEPGYIVGMQEEARRRFAFPHGPAWL